MTKRQITTNIMPFVLVLALLAGPAHAEEATAGGAAGQGLAPGACLCGLDPDGASLCFPGSTSCDIACTVNADCPDGSACLVDSCCGEPVCVPVCELEHCAGAGGSCSTYQQCEAGVDCNQNGIDDLCDVDCANPGCALVSGCGKSPDCNGNGIPDECELAGNDCQPNGIPDECELAGNDCQPNGTPDDCERDCNDNNTPDECDLPVSHNCCENRFPDPGCSDPAIQACVCALDPFCCNDGWDGICANEVEDLGCGSCGGGSLDCNADQVPDECEVPPLYDCCSTGHGTGCSDASVESCVCAADPFCCDVEWDGICANEVEGLGCGSCDPDCNINSIPDECEGDPLCAVAVAWRSLRAHGVPPAAPGAVAAAEGAAAPTDVGTGSGGPVAQLGIGDCLCGFDYPTGDPVCWADAFCDGQVCSATSDCPAGYACVDTCCGTPLCFASCNEPCTNPGVCGSYDLCEAGVLLPIPLDPAASGDSVVSEPRRDGVRMIEVDFDVDVTPCYAPGQVSVVNGAGLTVASDALVNAGQTLRITFVGSTDETCPTIDIGASVNCLFEDADCAVRILAGNTNGDENTDLIDMSQTKSKNGAPVAGADVRFDVNTDGNIDLIDMSLIKSLNGGSASCP